MLNDKPIHSSCSQPLRSVAGSLRISLLLVLLLVVPLLLGGCGGRYMSNPIIAPDVQIRNTDHARELVAMVEDYQEALSRRNTAAIRSMVSRDYYENAGTTDTHDDDYGIDGLMELLDLIDTHVRELRVEFLIRDLSVDERRNRATVTYEYAYTMLYRIEGQDMWDTARDLNRLDFVLEDERWLIVGGL